MQLEKDTLALLPGALHTLESGFASVPDVNESIPGRARMAEVMQEVAVRLQDNYPYFHPFYAGQMLKPPHPIARAAYSLASWINPNNHALDGGRASSAMEKEAVAEIAAMFGWQDCLGHLTSGGIDGEPRSALGRWPTPPRQEDCGLLASSLHPPPNQ